MANGYKYVCAVSALFRAARAFVRGPAQRISCMSGTRYHNPDSRPSESVNRVRVRDGLLANQGRAAVSRSIGPAGVGGSPAVVRVVGESGWGGGVPVCRKPGARVCRIKRVSVCPAVGRAVGCRYGCRPARKRRCGRMPGPPSAGCPACRDMRGSVNRTAPSVCRKGTLAAGAGALPCLPAKMKGAPKGSLPHQKLTLKNYPLFGRPP